MSQSVPDVPSIRQALADDRERIRTLEALTYNAEPPTPATAVLPWLVLQDSTVEAANNANTPIPFGIVTRMNDPTGVYLDWDTTLNGTGSNGSTHDRIRAIIKDQGVYLIELDVLWDGSISSGEATLALNIAAATGIGTWENNSGERITRAFVDGTALRRQRLFTTLFKYNTADLTLDPYGKQTTGTTRDLSGNFLKIVRLGDGGPDTDWDTAFVT